jgi:hypothetical protein
VKRITAHSRRLTTPLVIILDFSVLSFVKIGVMVASVFNDEVPFGIFMSCSFNHLTDECWEKRIEVRAACTELFVKRPVRCFIGIGIAIGEATLATRQCFVIDKRKLRADQECALVPFTVVTTTCRLACLNGACEHSKA